MTNDNVKRSYDVLMEKRRLYASLFSYAEGNQPIKYSTDRLREAFDAINVRFSQNWCAVVIDAAADRLELKGWNHGDDRINAQLDSLWNTLSVVLEADDVHWSSLVTGEGYIIAWQKDGEPEIYYNSPQICHIFYDPESPKKKLFAVKWYEDIDKIYRMVLYYPDRIEYYSAGGSQGLPSSSKAFKLDQVAENPFGEIPVFHFRRNRRGTGELSNILTLQDAVNKLLADMLVAAEYSAYKQRWIISNADTENLKNAPNEIWTIPAGDGAGQSTSVGQFDATDLGVYLNAIDKLASSIAIISRTPKHYFFSQAGDPSGEALIAMEAPLNKKVLKYQELFSSIWQEIAVFLLRLLNISAAKRDIIPVWDKVETVQPKTEAEIIEKYVSAGIPLVTALRWLGKSEQDIVRLEADIENAKMKNTAMAQALLEQIRVQDEQSNVGVGE